MGEFSIHTSSPAVNDQMVGLDMDQVQELRDQASVLIVDDDTDTVDLLKITLRKSGYNVIGAADGEQALEKCVDLQPDIVLLDLMMPVLDGWQTLDQLRKITAIPIMVVSALDQDVEVVRALAQGADDYIRKPFSAKELVARVQAAIRRSPGREDESVLIFPQLRLVINLDTRQVALNDEQVKLTPNEFSVLAALARYPRKPVRYENIAKEIWGEYTPKIHKRLKWTVHVLRRKLEEFGPHEDIIINHPKFGYQFLA